jgi:hypothetical protein
MQQTAIVFGGGVECETIKISIEGSLMTVDGPYWFGEGIFLENEYVGTAHYKTMYNLYASPMKPVFHTMKYDPSARKYSGQARFPHGAFNLEWRVE